MYRDVGRRISLAVQNKTERFVAFDLQGAAFVIVHHVSQARYVQVLAVLVKPDKAGNPETGNFIYPAKIQNAVVQLSERRSFISSAVKRPFAAAAKRLFAVNGG